MTNGSAKPYTQDQYNRALAWLKADESRLLPQAPWWAQEAIKEQLTDQVLANFVDGLLTAALGTGSIITP